MSEQNNATFFATVFIIAIILFLFSIPMAHSRDNGEYDHNDPTVKWYESLMMPDAPTTSCCGVADAYWCDGIHVRDDKAYCTITDDRVVKNRTPVPVGTEIEIPPNKMMNGHVTHGNPTGHSIVFLNSGGTYVYCFIMDSGT